jgi:hypothetical protein
LLDTVEEDRRVVGARDRHRPCGAAFDNHKVVLIVAVNDQIAIADRHLDVSGQHSPAL